MDVVIENGVVYELKTTDDLSNKHKSQLINYLLLAGLNYGKVINFKPSSVDSWFVTTTLSPQERVLFQVDEQQWVANDDADREVRDVFCELLHEWGAYLDFCLYKEALLHFTQGPDAGLLPVEIKVDGRVVGMQNMCLLNPETAWVITAIHDQVDNHGTHLKRLLSHTELDKLHWFNLNKKNITLRTLPHDPVIK